MAQEHGMIEPFVENQVRDGVISYGLSSYGYDIRIADEFKVFTNVYNTVVDPKHFDARSFVDIKGEYCDIPPNSFALARTVEYFRIPRNVLAICVGKSTYARCFRGDTRVALVDGTAPTLEEMARRAEDGEMFWGYSIDPYGRMIVSLLDAPRYIGRDALVEVLIDNGEPICCTPDHQFLMRDGRMVAADELRPGDSLMPLYRNDARGYEMVYQPLNGHLYPTHRMADEWNVRNGVYADQPGTHRHHVDYDRRNNMPWNLVRMDASEHIRLHNRETFGEEFDPDEHSAAIREAFGRLSHDPEWRKNFVEAQRARALQFWHDEAFAEAQAERQREIMRKVNIREEITADVVRAALDETGSIRGAARLLQCDRAVFRRFPDVVGSFKGQKQTKNHKVVSIQELPGDHDVYCLTVPEAGNFALEAGVFVRNCGIIVNTTPFEPGWRGFVTLELSNSTPLPARIYANEGIGQVLFFESDEQCDVSYDEKKGKYLDQVGVVPPRL
jgi:dCTP deaminase